VKYPELKFSHDSVENILSCYASGDTFYVADKYNVDRAAKFGRALHVSSLWHNVLEDRLPDQCSRIVAVGGCSALDVGRYHAMQCQVPLINIPTILSTSCISVNYATLRPHRKRLSFKGAVPSEVIIPVVEMLAMAPEMLQRWCASGLGDLFSNVSASIYYCISTGTPDFEQVLEYAEEAFEAADWVAAGKWDLNEDSICILATHLHNSCLDVIKRDSRELSAGFEHEMYETFLQLCQYDPEQQTHGILVAIGTLLTVYVYEKVYPHSHESLLVRLKQAYKAVGLPTDRSSCLAHGVPVEDVKMVLGSLDHHKNILTEHIAKHGMAVVDNVLQ